MVAAARPTVEYREELMAALREVFPAVEEEVTIGRLVVRSERDRVDQVVRRVTALTDREVEVCACVLEGMTTAEIAEALVISLKTVEAHRAHIRDKLRVLDRGAVPMSTVDRTLYRAFYTRVGYNQGRAAARSSSMVEGSVGGG